MVNGFSHKEFFLQNHMYRRELLPFDQKTNSVLFLFRIITPGNIKRQNII